ncbi:perforin-1-like [Hemicordylus capensis]|uniref:perforin-1-like n=1 Tax=Hemicordylus capensis TaxID=884348 RepID=UPI002302E0FC|nr:perforin-1-like [Hemicordylus capensis]XP_053115013.1 perforin-1-like [Hemicordylus capensis]
MPQLGFFLTTFLPFLCFLPATSPGHCQSFPGSVCDKHTGFVPGHNLIGEGVDITTLERKVAYVVDISRWQGKNGTCVMCQNPLMGGQLQKLPLDIADWRVHGMYRWKESSSMEYSDVSVANDMATEVKNDWKTELGLSQELMGELGLPTIQVAFAGSRSKVTLQAHRLSRQDRYSFLRHEFSCEHYRLRLHNQPQLSSDFFQAVARLPRKFDPEEYRRFISIYGTHYISQVHLGGRVRHLLALQTCRMALEGAKVDDVKKCLTLDISLGAKVLFGSISSKCLDQWRGQAKELFSVSYHKQSMDVVGGVVGGDSLDTVRSSGAGEVHGVSEWMASVKARPEVIAYSLQPLHTLLTRRDAKRVPLREALKNYITQRALRRDCSQQCPYGGYWNSDDSCTCMCQADAVNNNMCCAWKPGRARLKFHIKRGFSLWGDHFSATDAYIKVFFQGREMRTRVVRGNNDPWWGETLDFGAITLSGFNLFKVEIWDSDVWNDDRLDYCYGKLEAGHHARNCYADYGHIEYSSEVECGHGLGGPSCHHYSPLHMPVSRFNDSSPWHRDWH